MKILALDIGGSKVIGAIGTVEDGSSVGSRDTFRKKCTLDFISRKELGHNTSQTELFEAIRGVLPDASWIAECDAVGVNIPGLTDQQTGTWVYAPFSGIRDVPIVSLLSKMLFSSEMTPRPIGIDNDVNACALAEKLFGICSGINDFLWITVSNGIGGGLVLNGEVYRGSSGNAGEIGHFVLVENGVKCGCGNLGCLEAEAAGPAIARRYRNLIAEKSINIPPGELAKIDAEKIAELARNEDEIAMNVYQTTGHLLGKAASYAANLLNLEMIVLGGGVSGSFDLIFPEMMNAVERFCFAAANRNLRIEKTALGYEAALVGACATGFLKTISQK